MIVEWFVDTEGPIVETAWGHHQDVPIFRALATQHNIVVEFKNRRRPTPERVRKYEEWLASASYKVGLAASEENRAFRKALLIEAIANGRYGDSMWIDTDSFGPVTDLDGNVIL